MYVFCAVLSGECKHIVREFQKALNDTDTYVEMWIVMVIKTHILSQDIQSKEDAD